MAADDNKSDDFLDRVRAMAKDLEMDEKDTEEFIRRAAEKKGYKQVITYVKGDESGGGRPGSGWFG